MLNNKRDFCLSCRNLSTSECKIFSHRLVRLPVAEGFSLFNEFLRWAVINTQEPKPRRTLAEEQRILKAFLEKEVAKSYLAQSYVRTLVEGNGTNTLPQRRGVRNDFS